MKKNAVSLKEIAGALNVSTASVSLVLNGKARQHGISLKLEKRILEYIAENDYKPNKMAQGLRTGKSHIIAMLVEDIADPFFSSIARIIEGFAYGNGYTLIYGSTENSPLKSRNLIKLFQNYQVDGYIVAPSPGIEEDINDLLADDKPVVLFDRPLSHVDTDLILVDNYEATYGLLKHMVDNGYQRIAMVTIVSEQVQMTERAEAYASFARDFGMQPATKEVIYRSNAETLVHEIQSFLKNTRADAVFFATNYIAEAGLQAISNLQLKVPADMAVAVFDDHTLFRVSSPTITAIAQPLQAIAYNVIDILLRRLQSPQSEEKPVTVRLPTDLVLRESTQNQAQVIAFDRYPILKVN